MLQERHVVSKDMNTDNSYVRKYIASWIFKLKTTSRHVQYDVAFFMIRKETQAVIFAVCY